MLTEQWGVSPGGGLCIGHGPHHPLLTIDVHVGVRQFHPESPRHQLRIFEDGGNVEHSAGRHTYRLKGVHGRLRNLSHRPFGDGGVEFVVQGMSVSTIELSKIVAGAQSEHIAECPPFTVRTYAYHQPLIIARNRVAALGSEAGVSTPPMHRLLTPASGQECFTYEYHGRFSLRQIHMNASMRAE